jgi:hypothetical protein
MPIESNQFKLKNRITTEINGTPKRQRHHITTEINSTPKRRNQRIIDTVDSREAKEASKKMNLASYGRYKST